MVHLIQENVKEASYRDQLASELVRRKMANPAYSLRAFAKTLAISPAFLSKILSGQKDLSPANALSIAEKLGYNREETAHFCQLVQLSKTSDPKLKSALSNGLSRDEETTEYVSLDLEAFQVISDWYHYAILELSQCQNSKAEILTPDYASKRLGISSAQAKSAINRLARLGLLKSVRGKWIKTDSYLAVPSGKPNRAIRNFHAQMIEKAKNAVEKQSIEKRDISGITIPISVDKIDLARKEIETFRKRMAKLLSSSRPTEVYQLNLQFFPLTETEKAEASDK